MLPEKGVHLQLSSEQSVADVGITQLDWKRVPQARSVYECGLLLQTWRGLRMNAAYCYRRGVVCMNAVYCYMHVAWSVYECGPLLQTWRGLYECGLLLHARGVVCV